MLSLSFTLPLRSPYFIYTGSSRLVSQCCNFILSPAAEDTTNLTQPLYICIIMAFFHPFTLISIWYNVDFDKCICVLIFVCVLGLLFWRAGLQITLPLSVTSTSWLDMRTVISSASFSHSGPLHLEPLQFPWCIRFGTAPTLDNHSWADEQTVFSAKSHCSLMPYAAHRQRQPDFLPLQASRIKHHAVLQQPVRYL